LSVLAFPEAFFLTGLVHAAKTGLMKKAVASD
jgi:hypothetical protein